MISQRGAFLKLSLAQIRSHPLQSFLLLIGIALGVALMTSVDLANHSAKQSFALTTQSLQGKTSHRIEGDALNETLYVALKKQGLGIPMAPQLQGKIELNDPAGVSWEMMGIDPFAESEFRAFLGDNPLDISQLKAFLLKPGAVFVSRAMAQQYGWRLGQTLKTRKGQKLLIAGILTPEDALAEKALNHRFLADLSTAQEVLQKPGQLSHIDLKLPSDFDKTSLEPFLKQGAMLIEPEAQNQTLQSMSEAFEINLSAMSLLALLVGMFLIYNTLHFSVLQRRRTFAILRSLGSTQRQLFTYILFEALLLSLMGAVLGLGLGILLGKAVLQLVTGVLNDHYYPVEVTGLYVSYALLLKGILAGVGAGALAVLWPAYEASKTPPVQVLQSALIEDKFMGFLPGFNVLGGVGMALGFGLLYWPSQSIYLGFAGLAGVVLGAALWVPWLTHKGLQQLVKLPLFSVSLAARHLSGGISRISVSIAALMLSVSIIIGVSLMVNSFRVSVSTWLQQVIQADIYITADQKMDPRLRQALQKFKGVQQVESSQSRRLLHDKGPLVLNALSLDTARNYRNYRWKSLPREDIWPALNASQKIIVSESLQRQHHLNMDHPVLRLPTPKGQITFEIVGVYQDYSSEFGSLIMSQNTYRQYWSDNQLTALALFKKEEQPLEPLLTRLSQTWPDLKIQDNLSLRQGALEVFDRTFAITDALRFLTLLVAFVGILSTLLTLQLEFKQEQALLRVLGQTPAQRSRFILMQSAILGGIAGVIALPVGSLMAFVLIRAIHVRSFGWSFPFILEAWPLVGALAVSVFAALLAGGWPAFKRGHNALAQEVRQS